MISLAEYFSLERDNILNPVHYKTIMQYQQQKINIKLKYS